MVGRRLSDHARPGLSRRIASAHHPVMLDADVVGDVEGDAVAVAREAGYFEDERPDARVLCVRLLGSAPSFVPMRLGAALATVEGKSRVFVRRGIAPELARWLVLHEVGEWHHARIGYVGEDVEERCNLFASCLTAPRPVYRALVKRLGLAHGALARALATTQSVTFLRSGEVYGYPTLLVRAAGSIVRGQPFGWPSLSLRQAEAVRHPNVTRVSVMGETRRVGLRAA